MQLLNLLLEFLCFGWTLVEAYPAQPYGHIPSSSNQLRSPRTAWGYPASNYLYGQKSPTYIPPRTPAHAAAYRPYNSDLPHYLSGSNGAQALHRPVPHPNYRPRYFAPVVPAVPQHPVYWYRPRSKVLHAPIYFPKASSIPPFVQPVPHPALRAPFQSKNPGLLRQLPDSYPDSAFSVGFHGPHSSTAKNSQIRVFTSPVRRNPRRLLVAVPQTETLAIPDITYGDEFPREEPTTQQSDLDAAESLVNASSRQPRKLVYGDEDGNDDPESSLEGGCGADLSCRTSYHCALLGGRPTFLPCSFSPKLYCCDLAVQSTIDAPSNSTVKSDPQCGWNREKTSRVIGGYNAEFGEIPWQAFVKVEGFRCGGALLSRSHVVTAAHCVVGRKESRIEVLLGELVLKRMVEELPHERRRVAQVIIHPEYENLNVDSYDVAILVLDRPVEYQANIVPICLPEPDESFTGILATVSGWGRVFADHEIRANHLQSVQVPVIGNRLCRKWLRSRGKYAGINADHVCAGYEEGGRDSCRGDSGGPLTYQKNGRWYLVGIVSAGFSCGKPRQPGIYHRVSHSVEWISKNVFS